MMPDLTLTLTWSLGLAVVALAYGHRVGARQAQGCPLSLAERFRDLLVLHAIGVGLVAATWFQSFPIVPVRARISMLRPITTVALGPIALWYCFALPLRLTRYLTRPRKDAVDAPHPLDGDWSREASFLDRIAEARDHAAGSAGAKDHPPSRALDRVGRLATSRPGSTASPGDLA